MVPDPVTLRQQCEIQRNSCLHLTSQFYSLLAVLLNRYAYRKQHLIADLAGLSASAITQYIKNNRFPNSLTVFRIGCALKPKIHEFNLLMRTYKLAVAAGFQADLLKACFEILNSYEIETDLEDHLRKEIQNILDSSTKLIQEQYPLLKEIDTIKINPKKV